MVIAALAAAASNVSAATSGRPGLGIGDSRSLRARQAPAAVSVAHEHVRVAAGGDEAGSVEGAGHLGTADDDRRIAVGPGDSLDEVHALELEHAVAQCRAQRGSGDDGPAHHVDDQELLDEDVLESLDVAGEQRGTEDSQERARCLPTARRRRARPLVAVLVLALLRAGRRSDGNRVVFVSNCRPATGLAAFVEMDDRAPVPDPVPNGGVPQVAP
jgi:hypothetical protein